MDPEVTPIVIPYKGGGKFGDYTELKYAIAAWRKFATFPHEIVVAGPNRPNINASFTYHNMPGLKSTLRLISQKYPAGFVWTYDDVIPLKPLSLEEVKQTPAIQHIGRSGTSWGNNLTRIAHRLKAEGLPTLDYSRPHGPYFFDQKMVDIGFEDWPGMAGKFPWETWILNKFRWPASYGLSAQYYSGGRAMPREGHRYLNFNDSGFDAALLAYLDMLLPEVKNLPEAEKSLTFHTHPYSGIGSSLITALDAIRVYKPEKVNVVWPVQHHYYNIPWLSNLAHVLFEPMEELPNSRVIHWSEYRKALTAPLDNPHYCFFYLSPLMDRMRAELHAAYHKHFIPIHTFKRPDHMQDCVGLVYRTEADFAKEQLSKRIIPIEMMVEKVNNIREGRKVFVSAHSPDSVDYFRKAWGSDMIVNEQIREIKHQGAPHKGAGELHMVQAWEDMVTLSFCQELVSQKSNMATVPLVLNLEMKHHYVQ
jgi:hypothetical protein